MPHRQAKQKNRGSGQRFIAERYLDMRLDETKTEITGELRGEMAGMKADLRSDMTDLKTGLRDEIRENAAKILQGVDKIVTRFDTAEKDHAAHTMLHKRIGDDLHHHDQRIKKLEARV